jgi:hypothetical protein
MGTYRLTTLRSSLKSDLEWPPEPSSSIFETRSKQIGARKNVVRVLMAESSCSPRRQRVNKTSNIITSGLARISKDSLSEAKIRKSC